MSKFGMKIGKNEVYGVKNPAQALQLIQEVVEQYFGEFWTLHKPKCPLCNEALSDCEKHMNRPVGECTNEKCDSTIHIADYFGKIKDVLNDWSSEKEGWERHQESLKAKPTDTTIITAEEALDELETQQQATASTDDTGTAGGGSIILEDEEIYVW